MIVDVPYDIKEFFAMEDGPVKNIMYYNKIIGRDYPVSDILKKEDGTMHHAHCVYTVKKGKKYYPKLKTKKGFTLDSKGKLKIWFGSNMQNSQHLYDVLVALKHDWFVNDSFLWGFMTKTLYEKILTGKITNPIDFLSGYLKLSRIKASPKLLYDVCKRRGFSKAALLKNAAVAKDFNHFLEWEMGREMSLSGDTPGDMIRQALILDKKIDFKWSPRRLEEEHRNWTREIMKIEADSIPDCKVNHYDMIRHLLPPYFEPLETQKRVFEEGSTMQHCVYTNYWKNIAEGTYMAFHVELNGEKATYGMIISYDGLRSNQLYGFRNSPVSPAMREAVSKAEAQLILKSKDIIKKYLSSKNLAFGQNANEEFLPF